MTKLRKKGSSNYKSWRNFVWKLMRTPTSTSSESNNSMTLIASKLDSRWDGPFIITKVLPYGAVELQDKLTRSTFQANGQQLKIFHEGPTTSRRGGEYLPNRTGHGGQHALSNTTTNPPLYSYHALRTMHHLSVG
ncbi:hypothetical protein CR513_07235, partial [Mucuna pruriens]